MSTYLKHTLESPVITEIHLHFDYTEQRKTTNIFAQNILTGYILISSIMHSWKEKVKETAQFSFFPCIKLKQKPREIIVVEVENNMESSPN